MQTTSKTNKWTIKKHFIAALVLVIISVFSTVLVMYGPLLIGLIGLFSNGNEAVSIGIIGGADGPTAIYVTKSTAPFSWFNNHVVMFIILMGLYKPTKWFMEKGVENEKESEGDQYE